MPPLTRSLWLHEPWKLIDAQGSLSCEACLSVHLTAQARQVPRLLHHGQDPGRPSLIQRFKFCRASIDNSKTDATRSTARLFITSYDQASAAPFLLLGRPSSFCAKPPAVLDPESPPKCCSRFVVVFAQVPPHPFSAHLTPLISTSRGLSHIALPAAMAALGDDLLATVNKLQDLVFNTIGNDSLDLPQIVCTTPSDRRAPPYPPSVSGANDVFALSRLLLGPSLPASRRCSKISSAEISFPVAAAS